MTGIIWTLGYMNRPERRNATHERRLTTAIHDSKSQVNARDKTEDGKLREVPTNLR
jgi:hypothetical protein